MAIAARDHRSFCTDGGENTLNHSDKARAELVLKLLQEEDPSRLPEPEQIIVSGWAVPN
jgi:hypothetical protein